LGLDVTSVEDVLSGGGMRPPEMGMVGGGGMNGFMGGGMGGGMRGGMDIGNGGNLAFLPRR